jgi:hypothetical protein
MYESIAPVWEANHMWLIIAIVILFVGFPEIYTTHVYVSSYSFGFNACGIIAEEQLLPSDIMMQ